MDPFTENILARARERQRKILEGYSGRDVPNPLHENNSERKAVTISEPNLTEVKKVQRKEVVSDSDIISKVAFYDMAGKENNSDSSPKFVRQNSRTRVASEIPGSPQPQLKTLNIQNDKINMEIKVTSTDNVRLEVEIEERNESDSETSEISDSGLREDAKNRLKRLGKLYAGGEDADISSPIHRTEANFYKNEVESEHVKLKDNTDASKTRRGLSKLADLAQNINEWEDDIHMKRNVDKKPVSPKKTWKPPAPQPPVSTSPTKASQKSRAPEPPKLIVTSTIKAVDESGKPTLEHSGDISPTKEKPLVVTPSTKHLKWDKSVLDTLESQGFTRTTSRSRLVYKYDSQDDGQDNKVKTANTTNIGKISNGVKADTISEEAEPELDQNKPVNKVVDDLTHSKVSPNSPTRTPTRTAAIADKAAMFEHSPSRNTKDPALLSVSERKALFEKNIGAALVPKAPFGMAMPVKADSAPKAVSAPTPVHDNVENVKPSVISKTEKVQAKPKYTAPKPPAPVVKEQPLSPPKAAVPQAGGIASKMAALLEGKSTISQEQIESNIREQRQKEMDLLLNRFNKNKEINEKVVEEVESDDDNDATEKTAMIKAEKSAKIISKSTESLFQPKVSAEKSEKRRSGGKRCSKEDSPIVTASLEDVKRIRVSPPKAGKLYPNLSDIEATTETETDNRTASPSPNSSFEGGSETDDPNTSFGREILQVVCKNQTPQKRPIYDESTASDISSVLDDIDEYLEEDLAPLDSAPSSGPSPPKQVRHLSPNTKGALPSHSFNFKSFSPNVKTPVNKFKSPSRPSVSPPRMSTDSTYVVEGDSVLPLTHTVSFYRKQQNQASMTPVRQITRQPLIEEVSESRSGDYEIVEKKIAELEEEVKRQQLIISQTSQALNLCNSTPEFSGSTEQVEAERVLLVASHRRQAALHELQRLKVEGTIRPQGQHSQNVPLEKGSLTISDIVLPLKQKYVTALAAAGGKGHHVVCLIKSGEQVVPTKLVSTVVNSKNPDVDLYIPGTVKLNNIYSDFTVTFEVYCLQAQEEFLPHEVKYHIGNKKSNNRLTPKKCKQDSRLMRAAKESPAGPQAVRSSSFALMGYVVFSVQALNKKQWTLNNVSMRTGAIRTPSMSPLEGIVQMKVSCELAVSVEHRGFLTMFEDISGFGAWHRRWCLLKGQTLSYWKYPDDEKKTAPIDSIDLNNCITGKVGPVSREICARLHTFLLERERMAYQDDKDTLVTVCKGDKTIIRHLLSADTKEERIEWCNKFNAALTAIRMWGSQQQ